jgi:hypothetical protein
MKNFLIMLFTSSLISCSLGIAKGKDGLPGLRLADCHSDRKTVGQLKSVHAKITSEGAEWTLVPIDDDSQRYGACNMVDFEFEEGQEVVFSANIKEILPNERWAATPIVLTAFDLKK